MHNAVLIHQDDNVATVLVDVVVGAVVTWNAAGGTGGDLADPRAPVTAGEAVPAGHKIAIADIAAGEAIRKYGHTIGVAGAAIARGRHVHTHNLTGQEA